MNNGKGMYPVVGIGASLLRRASIGKPELRRLENLGQDKPSSRSQCRQATHQGDRRRTQIAS